jgi:methionine sulfoxide reductase heme-binding subunit
MSISYTFVQWNKHKRVYDVILIVGIIVFLAAFVAIGSLAWPGENAIGIEVLLIRATAICAFALLHITLAIGPLARLTSRAAPLLYNRRHLGVATFFVGLLHAVLATGYYGAFGGVNPIRAMLGSGDLRSISAFPFEWLGLAALFILFAMAATSHDFWLKVLSPRVWKRLHMCVYVAYVAIVAHVALGALQSERHLLPAIVLASGALSLCILHALAGLKQRKQDNTTAQTADDADWLEVAPTSTFIDSRAKIVCLQSGEPIAVFRHGDTFHAVANVCAHQGGPLGEGAIIDGCITCPWHGYQYLPQTGKSPPPFTEQLATYEVRIRGEMVHVHRRARTIVPQGTDH